MKMAHTVVGASSTPKKTHHVFLSWSSLRESRGFWRGVASAYEMFGRDDRLLSFTTPREADYHALRGDWNAIGRDMRHVMLRFEREHAEELAGQERLFDPDSTR
jgi:hypothetical protein